MASDTTLVLGSGPNELVLACMLAKAGQNVVVLPGDAPVGGPAALHAIPSDKGTFRAPIAPQTAGWVSPRIVKDLGLEGHGFEAAWAPASSVTLRTGGAPLVLYSDVARSRSAIEALSKADAAKWEAFSTRMGRLAGFLEVLYEGAPPRLMSAEPGDLFSLMGVGLRLRRLGKTDMIELLRTLPMSVQDLLDEWFETDFFKAAVGAGGLPSLAQGPRSAGTCFVLLHHLVGRPLGGFRARTVVKSEAGHLVHVLERAAKKLGVTFEPGSVDRVRIERGVATGVILASGKELAARRVVSGADPRTTFLRLVGAPELDPEVVHAAAHVKLRGVRAVVNLALSEKPAFTGLDDEALSGVISVAPNLDYLERAYDATKYGQISEGLFVEATIPSLSDPSLAPPGAHVMSIGVQYCPYALREGAWDRPAEGTLADRVIALLGEHAPNLARSVVGRAVFTPADLEARFGLAEGHLHGGEHTLDQLLFMRPIPGSAHYRTPIEGLFLCGDGTHPGGNLPGLAGANAAREILRGGEA
jgi:phytoene dehydrogenase-like protein